MKSIAKEAVYHAAVTCGLPRVIHRCFYPHTLSIIMYHAVVSRPLAVPDWCFLSEKRFAEQMVYLAEHFNVLPLSDALESLSQGRIERPTAAITFDDGFQNNFDVAFPILARLRLPATIYLTTGLIDTEETVWFCKVVDALARSDAKTLTWNDLTLSLRSRDEKRVASVLLQRKLKELPHGRLLDEVDRIVAALGSDPGARVARSSPFRMLDAESVGTMLRSGLVEAGAHTHSHAILATLPPAQQAVEIRHSVAAVAQLTGRTCEHFAYPNGRRQDYDAQAMGVLADHGIRTAVTTVSGPNVAETASLELKRYGVGAETSGAAFRLLVHHTLSHFHPYKRTRWELKPSVS